MSSLVRRYLKTAVCFLAVVIGLGVWMLGRRELTNAGISSYVVSAHTHAILVGFVMMMILGVALWMFPRPTRDDRQYRPQHAAAAYWLVTMGTGTRVAGELLRLRLDQPWLRWCNVAAGAVQGVGLL